MPMTSRERLLCALRRETPDRLPATVHQWQPYHLRRFMGGVDDLQAFRAVGLDAAIARSGLLPADHPAWGYSNSTWRISHTESPGPDNSIFHRYTFDTPQGSLSCTLQTNEITTWTREPLLKTESDIDLYTRHAPLPRIDHDAVRHERDRIHNHGILRGFVPGFQPGPWQDAVELYGLERMLTEVFENPDWVRHVLDRLLDRKTRFVEEQLRGAPFDLIETGGGAASTTVISPAIFDEFLLPVDTALHRTLHDAGFPVVYHTCGGMTALLDRVWRNGCDASETLTPEAMGGDIKDLAAVKRTLGSRAALIGGIDQENVLRTGTEDEIRQHVRDRFETYGAGGGYIASPSDHFFHVPVANLHLFARAAAECRYPS